MNRTLSILLIEDNIDYAELVGEWLSNTTGRFQYKLAWTETLSGGVKRLATGDIDIVVLDLGLPDATGNEGFAQIKAIAPHVPVLVLSAADNEAAALDLIRQGAEDYLVKTTCTGEALQRGLDFAYVRHSANADRGTSRTEISTIGVLGARGGAGTSTIAQMLATELKRQTNDQVLLIDLDMNFGNQGLLAGKDAMYTMRDAVENLARLDAECFEKIVTHGPDFDLLASAVAMGSDDLHDDRIQRVVEIASGLYRWTVLDLARPGRLAMRMTKQVGHLLLVSTPDVAGLYQAKRAIQGLENSGTPKESVRIIVNEVASNSGLNERDLQSVFGIPVSVQIPNDLRNLQNALLRRELIPESSPFRRSITSLARDLAGLPEVKLKRGLAPFLQRLRSDDKVRA